MSGQSEMIIACCRIPGGTSLGDGCSARGPNANNTPTTAPTARGYVLTPIDADRWREFVYANPDHPALLSGDLFAADLGTALARCRAAPPRSRQVPFDQPALREAAE